MWVPNTSKFAVVHIHQTAQKTTGYFRNCRGVKLFYNKCGTIKYIQVRNNYAPKKKKYKVTGMIQFWKLTVFGKSKTIPNKQCDLDPVLQN